MFNEATEANCVQRYGINVAEPTPLAKDEFALTKSLYVRIPHRTPKCVIIQIIATSKLPTDSFDRMETQKFMDIDHKATHDTASSSPPSSSRGAEQESLHRVLKRAQNISFNLDLFQTILEEARTSSLSHLRRSKVTQSTVIIPLQNKKMIVRMVNEEDAFEYPGRDLELEIMAKMLLRKHHTSHPPKFAPDTFLPSSHNTKSSPAPTLSPILATLIAHVLSTDFDHQLKLKVSDYLASVRIGPTPLPLDLVKRVLKDRNRLYIRLFNSEIIIDHILPTQLVVISTPDSVTHSLIPIVIPTYTPISILELKPILRAFMEKAIMRYMSKFLTKWTWQIGEQYGRGRVGLTKALVFVSLEWNDENGVKIKFTLEDGSVKQLAGGRTSLTLGANEFDGCVGEILK